MKTGALGPEASIGKLFWTTLAPQLRRDGDATCSAPTRCSVERGAATATYELDELHYIFMASRAETIYAGASEIQHNIIGERVLGLATRAPLSRSTTT